ncbi:hypothetical protein C7972_102277 [Arenibacter sp. ARW7G5Y1]|nr:hypothetical protein C7972_102277 [Arenibacter sp. ARW7G5Y1]
MDNTPIKVPMAINSFNARLDKKNKITRMAKIGTIYPPGILNESLDNSESSLFSFFLNFITAIATPK